MRRHLPLGLGAAAIAVALCVLAAWSPVADALEPAFLVNGGAGYTRVARVTAGDGGRSPFFRPGVVVWDGGSIVLGRGAEPAFRFPVQTLAMVPRACRSYVSASSGARIADMIAEGPTQVDARYRPDADLNVCLVLAGGGDFRAGETAASVYESLGTYCRQRRAAGFRVIVITVLPSHRTETFEATRLVYNAMVRDGWREFADGLADIGADPRIGDSGDEYNTQYYLVDQLHPNNAGNLVMAAVTAPVLEGLAWTSRRCEVRVRDAAGPWGDWLPWSAMTSVWLGDYQGEHVIEAEYRLDGGPPVAVTDAIFFDDVRPAPRVLRDAVVRRGKTAVLHYQVDDARPCGPTATVVVRLTTKSGRTLRTFVRRRVPVNTPAAVSFQCSLPKGAYRWSVRARDTAGNPEAAPAAGRLVVR